MSKPTPFSFPPEVTSPLEPPRLEHLARLAADDGAFSSTSVLQLSRALVLEAFLLGKLEALENPCSPRLFARDLSNVRALLAAVATKL